MSGVRNSHIDCGGEKEWFLTCKRILSQAFFDPVCFSDVECFSDFLIHKTLFVHDVLHHHSEVKHLKEFCYLCNFHQVLLLLIQLSRVQEAEDCTEWTKLDGTVHLHHCHGCQGVGHWIDYGLFVDAVESLAPRSQGQFCPSVLPAETHHLQGAIALGCPEGAGGEGVQVSRVFLCVQAEGPHQVISPRPLGHNQAWRLLR